MNNKTHITESVAHYRDLLQTIEEENIGAKVLKGLFGKSAKEIAEKLGSKVVTVADGEKTVWKRIDKSGDDVVYEVIHSDGKTAIGTPIKPEDLAQLKPRPFDTRIDPIPYSEKPKFTVKRGETQDQAAARVQAEIEAGKVKGPLPEPHLDPDNIKQGPAHDPQGRLEPKPGGHTSEEIWKAAAAKQAYVESMIKSGKGKFKEKAIQDQVDAGVPLLDAVDSLQPGKGVKQKIENDPKLKDKFFGAIESAWRKGKRVIIVAILIAIGLWLLTRDKKPDDKKTGDPAQGNQQSDTSAGESSASGTSLAADEIPWLEMGINPKAYEGSTLSQTTIFGKVIDDNWIVKTPQGTVGGYVNDPAKKEIIKKVLAMTPEERRAYKIQSDRENAVPAQGSGDGSITFVPTTEKTPGVDLPTVSFTKPVTVPLYKDTEPPKTQVGKDDEVDDVPVMTLPSKSKKEGVHRGR